MKKISIDEPHVTNLICWSDSCVPQNRNSYILQAILEFLYQQEKISSIIMKYCIVRHSGVQEVDNMQKQNMQNAKCKIEGAMKVVEFYSPVSFLRLLLNGNRNIPYRVIQLNKVDFKDYQSSSKMRMFSRAPYTKVCQLKFDKENLHIIEYKQSHSDENFKRLILVMKRRNLYVPLRNKESTSLLLSQTRKTRSRYLLRDVKSVTSNSVQPKLRIYAQC